MTMEMEWQVAPSSARLAEAEGGTQHQTIAGEGGGQRRVQGRQPVGRTLWAEEDEEGEGQEEQEQADEAGEEDQEGGVGSDDKGRIVAFIRRMAFNVGLNAVLDATFSAYRRSHHHSKRSSLGVLAQLVL